MWCRRNRIPNDAAGLEGKDRSRDVYDIETLLQRDLWRNFSHYNWHIATQEYSVDQIVTGFWHTIRLNGRCHDMCLDKCSLLG